MDVRLPNGEVIRNVPEGTSKADLVAKLRRNGHDLSWLEPPAQPAAANSPVPEAEQPAAQPVPDEEIFLGTGSIKESEVDQTAGQDARTLFKRSGARLAGGLTELPNAARGMQKTIGDVLTPVAKAVVDPIGAITGKRDQALDAGIETGVRVATGEKLSGAVAESAPVTTVRDWTKAKEQEAVAALSPKVRRALELSLVERDEAGDLRVGEGASDPWWWTANLIDVGVQMAPGIGATGVAARVGYAGRYRQALAEMAERGVPQSVAMRYAQRQGIEAAKRSAGIVGSLTEGATAGGQNAAEVRDVIESLTEEQLMSYPGYLELRDRGMAHEQARAEIVKDKAAATAIAAAAVVGLTGAPMNRFFGGMAAKMGRVAQPAKGRLREIAKATAGEAAQEFVQEGAEGLIVNDALQTPGESIWTGVLEQAITGAVLGGVVGGGGATIAQAVPAKKKKGEPPITETPDDVQRSASVTAAHSAYVKAKATLDRAEQDAADPGTPLKKADLDAARETHEQALVDLTREMLQAGNIPEEQQPAVAKALQEAEAAGVTSTRESAQTAEPQPKIDAKNAPPPLSAKEQQEYNALEAVATAQEVSDEDLATLITKKQAVITPSGAALLTPAGRRARTSLGKTVKAIEKAEQAAKEPAKAKPAKAAAAPAKAKIPTVQPAKTQPKEPAKVKPVEPKIPTVYSPGEKENIERARRGLPSRKTPKGRPMAMLKGMPATAKIGNITVDAKPVLPAKDAAASYRKAKGITTPEVTQYVKVDPKRSKKIAQAFEEMKHEPNNPEVKRAYSAMIDETKAQWDEIKKSGLKVEFIKPGQPDPYAASPRMAIEDVRNNNHLWVFPTDSGFGSDNKFAKGNPMLEDAGESIGGHRLKNNDVFRIVHDYFGHIAEGNGFRADGEENAWRIHSTMYSPLARRAMTTETRGQNSWVNYGPKGEKNRSASAGETVYADQKIGLLPEEFSRLDEEVLKFKHYSTQADLAELDPSKMGTGAKGAEAKRAGPKVLALYAADGEVEPDVTMGKTRYDVEVPRERLYDASADPQGFYDKARVPVGMTPDENGHLVPVTTRFDMNKFEEMVRAAGFDGYHTPEAPGILKGQARLFVKTPARRSQATIAASVSNRPAAKTKATNPDKVLRLLTDQERQNLREDTTKKLVKIFDELPAGTELASAALAGQAKRGWYARSAQAIVDVFGPDAPRFAAVLAAMSPQTSVEWNFRNAAAVWVGWDKAGRPTDAEAITKVMRDSVFPNSQRVGKANVLPAWINNTVRALSAEDPSTVVLSGPKVDSFASNLRGETDKVTLDAWMANFALVEQKIFAGSATKTGPGLRPGYLAYTARVREAAELLTARTGETWTPAEVQETVWSWAKTVYEQADMFGDLGTASELVEQGEITDALINATPDFAGLFASPEVRNILAGTAYSGRVADAVSRNEEAQSRAGGQATPLTESDRANLKRAAKRLEALKAQRAAGATAAVNTDPNPLFGIPLDRLTAVAQEINDVLGVQGTIVEDTDELMDHVPMHWHGALKGYGRHVQGLFVPDELTGDGHVYYVRSNIDSDQEARDVALHEVVGHMGLRAILGENYNKTMAAIYASFPDQVRAAARRNNIDLNHPNEAARRYNRMLAAEELVAYSAGRLLAMRGPAAKQSVWNKIVDMVRRALRAINVLAEYTEGDIESLIYRARDYFRRPAESRARENAYGEEVAAAEKKGGPGPVWHSPVERIVEDLPLNAGSAGQWIGSIKNAKGVKQEELDWLGINRWLHDQGAKITKAQLLDFIRANKIEVQDVVYGEDDGRVAAVTEKYGAAWDALFNAIVPKYRAAASQELVQRAARGNLSYTEVHALQEQGHTNLVRDLRDAYMDWDMTRRNSVPSTVKYANYQTPGGENYRELLLTLPMKTPAADPITNIEELPRDWRYAFVPDDSPDAEEGWQQMRLYDPSGRVVARHSVASGATEAAMSRAIVQAYNELTEYEAQDRAEGFNFQSGHWSPKNIVLHVRFNERTVDGKKVLFIEEVQSDWHQQGRKQGYASKSEPVDTSKWKVDSVLTREGGTFYQVIGAFPTTGASTQDNDVEVPGYRTREEAQGYIDRLTKGIRDFKDSEASAEMLKQIERFPLSVNEFTVAPARYIKVVDTATGDTINRVPGFVGTDEEAIADAAHLVQERRRDRGVPDAPFKTSWPELAMKRMIRYAAEKGFDKIAWTTGAMQNERYNLGDQVDEITWFQPSSSVDGQTPTTTVHIHPRRSSVIAVDVDAEGRITFIDRGDEGIVGRHLGDLVGQNIADRILSKPEGKLAGVEDLKIGGEGMKGFYDRILPKTVDKYVKKWGSKTEPATILASGATQYIVRENDDTFTPDDQPAAWDIVSITEGEVDEIFATYKKRADAERRAAELNATTKRTTPVHSVAITPQMRESVLESQPIFAMKRATNNPTPEEYLAKDGVTFDTIDFVVDQERELRLGDTMRVIDTGRPAFEPRLTEAGMPVEFDINEDAEIEFDPDFDAALSADPDDQMALTMTEVAAVVGGVRVGYVTIASDNITDTGWSADYVFVKPEYRGLGIAQKMYKAVSDRLGVKPKPSDIQTGYGERMWKSFKKRGVAFSFKQAPTGDPDLDDFISRIGGDKPTLRQRMQMWNQDKADRVTVAAFDRYHGIKRAEDLAGITSADSGYKSAVLSGSSGELVQSIIDYGPPVWNQGAPDVGQGASLREILKPLGNNLNLWLTYVTARRASRLMGEGRENLFPQASINAALKLGPQHPEFDVVLKAYNDLQKKVLDFAEQAGVIDPTTRSLWEHADYIPFYRIIENGQVGASPKGGKGIGFVKNQIRRLRGGKANIGDPLENIVRNWLSLMDASLKAHAGRQIVDNLNGTGLVTPHPSLEFTQAIVPLAEVKKFLKTNPQLAAVFKSVGLDPAKLPASAFAGLQKMTAVQAPTEEDVISVWRAGKREYWKVHDPLLFMGLQELNAKAWGPLMKLLTFPKRLLTQGVTLTPQFSIKNYLRDVWHVFVQGAKVDQTKLTVLPHQSLAGLPSTILMDATAQSLLASGGSFTQGYVNAGNPEGATSVVRRAIRGKTAPVLLDSPAKLWRFYRNLQNAAENANRVAIYKIARKKGLTHKEAAYEARDLLDFSKKGAHPVMQFLVDSVPFFNARVQGLYRLGRALKTDLVAVGLRGLLITAASAALLVRNYDDERYKALTNQEKANYWHFFDVFEEGDHFKFPKPFEVGTIFGTVPEAIGDAMLTNADEPDNLKTSGQYVGYAFAQSLNLSPQPQAIWPLVELAVNKDSFTQAPILTDGDKNLPAYDQFGPRTSPTYRELAQLMPDAAPEMLRSPKQLEHLGRGYLGNLQDYALLATDVMVRQLRGEPPAPAKAAQDLPGLRDFRTMAPARNTKYITAMYEIATEAAKIQAGIKKNKDAETEEGDARVEDLETENAQLLDVAEDFKAAAKRVNDLKKQQRQIQLDPDMSPQEKREEIDLIQQDINDEAESVWDLRPGGKLNQETAVELLEAPPTARVKILRKAGMPATADLLEALV